MKCRGEFVFKTLTHRAGGTFKSEDGSDVSYKPAYILKVDELMDNGEINERKFKIEEDSIALLNTLKTLQAYQKITLIFNVTIYTSSLKLELSDVELYDGDDD